MPTINDFLEIFNRIKERNEEKKCIKIELINDTSSSITISKLGGLPYIAPNSEIPRDLEGNVLNFLCQLNCQEIPENSIYPKTGIIQFWIGRNNTYGLDFSDPINNIIKVLYYKEINDSLSIESIKEIYYNDESQDPLKGEEYLIKFSNSNLNEKLKWDNFNFQDEFLEEWNTIYPENQIEELYDLAQYLDLNEFSKYIHEDPISKIGGYPSFVQEDPRKFSNGRYKEYTEVLLQIVSNDIFTWGDFGIVNFLIDKKNLEELNFSEVLYNWDTN